MDHQRETDRRFPCLVVSLPILNHLININIAHQHSNAGRPQPLIKSNVRQIQDGLHKKRFSCPMSTCMKGIGIGEASGFFFGVENFFLLPCYVQRGVSYTSFFT